MAEADDLGALAQLLSARVPVTVVWEVLPVIGPGWVGGGRTVVVRVGDRAVDEADPGARALARAVVAALAIPETSETLCVVGVGELHAADGGWAIAWEVTESVPYGSVALREGVTALTVVG